MVEVVPLEIGIVACHDRPDRLAQWRPGFIATVLQIAADERWLVVSRADRESCEAEARPLPTTLVVDETDGWFAWSLRGNDRDELMARLMFGAPTTSGPTMVQGNIAGLPGRAVAFADELLVFVPAPVRHALVERIGSAARGLELVMRDAEPYRPRPA